MNVFVLLKPFKVLVKFALLVTSDVHFARTELLVFNVMEIEWGQIALVQMELLKIIRAELALPAVINARLVKILVSSV